MTADEFSRCHPAFYTALCDAWKRRERRSAQRFASLMALIANCNRREGTSPFTAEDFMGGRRRRQSRRRAHAKAGEAFFRRLVAEGAASVREKGDDE